MKPKYNLKEVSRTEYMQFTKNIPHENIKPIEGNDLCVTQFVDDDGNLIAQSIYFHVMGEKCIVYYYIKE